MGGHFWRLIDLPRVEIVLARVLETAIVIALVIKQRVAARRLSSTHRGGLASKPGTDSYVTSTRPT